MDQNAEAGPSPQKPVVSCFRCGRTLTNPLSVAIGIGPICRSRGKGSSGGYGGGPGYPNKDAVSEVPAGFDHTEGRCGCAITSIPPELLGVTFAKECLRYCCQHCPSRGEAYCPAESLREEGKLRAYEFTPGNFCLGYWVERVDEEERLWAVYYNTDEVLGEMAGMLWIQRPLNGLPQLAASGQYSVRRVEWTLIAKPPSLLAAQICAVQATPLEA